PHMVPKQREMDGIVEEIYSSLEEQDHLSSTLFVLCGDHGMNDGGNHGGSSPGETSAALVFMSPHFKQLQANAAAPAQQSDDFQFYETVEQSDIAPTLAGLLGFAVPLNSLGVFIPDFLPSWKDQSQRIAVLLRNARQLLNVVKTKFPYHNFDGPMDREACASNSKSDDVVLGCYWSEALLAIDKAKAGERSYDTAESALLAFSREAQRVMSNVASNYNIKSLHTASGLGALSTLMSLAASIPLLRNQALTSLVFLTFVAVYGATMIASSYVEEEQQSWHWILSGWHCYLFIKSGGLRGSFTDTLRRILTLFVFPRFIRRWNQTGQKFTGEPDLVDFLYTKPCLLWALVTYTYLGIFSRLFTSMAAYKSRCKSVAMALPAVIVAFLFKVAFTHAQSPELIPESVSKLQHLTGLLPDISLVTQARIGFILMAVIVVLNFARWDQHGKSAKAASAAIPRERKFKVLHEVMTLFLATQSRAENIPMFQLYSWQVSTMSRLQLSSFDVLVTSLVQQYTSFFAFGGSNSISSIDLSSAYNGISGYNVIAVGILTFVGNWAGPIWWVFATQELLLRHGNRTGFRREVPGQAPPLWQRLSLLTFFVSSSLLAVMLACTALRTHLFIWSVFSPKFLYSMAWTLAHYLIVNVLLGGVILSLI
ncbi:major facilitator super transporter protein, partial [Ascosphaera atra]